MLWFQVFAIIFSVVGSLYVFDRNNNKRIDDIIKSNNKRIDDLNFTVQKRIDDSNLMLKEMRERDHKTIENLFNRIERLVMKKT